MTTTALPAASPDATPVVTPGAAAKLPRALGRMLSLDDF